MPVSLYINSPGGSIPATLAIYDAMQFIRPRVQTTCVGQAAATSALLLAGGAPGSRSILPHGRVVIHAPAAEGRGTVPDLILEAEEVERVRTMQEEILAWHTGRTAAQVLEDTKGDLILAPGRGGGLRRRGRGARHPGPVIRQPSRQALWGSTRG